MKFGLALCLMVFGAAPLRAQEFGLTGAQIVQGGQMPDGRALAALVLTLAPGWKTYWRSPGEGGLPPEFDWSASTNLAEITPIWPNPQVFDVGGIANIGYEETLVLPLAITAKTPALPVLLQGNITIGVCKDICMPAELALTAQVTGNAPALQIIDAALAQRPLSAQNAGVSALSCTAADIKDGLRVQMTLTMPKWAGIAAETVVVEHADRKIWASAVQMQRAGDVISANFDLVPPQAKPFALNGGDLRITLLAGAQVAEIQGCQIP